MTIKPLMKMGHRTYLITAKQREAGSWCKAFQWLWPSCRRAQQVNVSIPGLDSTRGRWYVWLIVGIAGKTLLSVELLIGSGSTAL